jgi:hypothetical protein
VTNLTRRGGKTNINVPVPTYVPDGVTIALDAATGFQLIFTDRFISDPVGSTTQEDRDDFNELMNGGLDIIRQTTGADNDSEYHQQAIQHATEIFATLIARPESTEALAP